jgi:mono/diheme cytochrome c family protein/uncharacterized membrane protein
MLLSILDLIGRLHPMLVHFPVGILLLACLFQWLAINSKFSFLQPAIPVVLFYGMLGAVVSCISGFILSQSGDYDAALVNRHQWLGISVAIVSVVLYGMYRFAIAPGIARWVTLVLFLITSITGHIGGTITHGTDYLTEALAMTGNKGPAIKPIANVQEAVLYADAIQPLLKARCYSCHGPNKQKGKLRLDAQDFIMQGGEDGKALVPGKTGEGEMMKRLLLPLTNKDHMPPKEKTQLSKYEIDLINWWISSGADFHKKIKELPQPDNIKPVLVALEQGSAESDKASADIPEQIVAKADEATVSKLKHAGVVVIPVAQTSNYLSVSFYTATEGTDSLIKLLEPIKDQLLWLNLSNTGITDSGMITIARLKTLQRIHLNNTKISDAGLMQLKACSGLRYINLINTGITLKGLAQLKDIKSLNSIYLYHSGVHATEWNAVKQLFPKAVIDTGGFVVPTFATDTTELKLPD